MGVGLSVYLLHLSMQKTAIGRSSGVGVELASTGPAPLQMPMVEGILTMSCLSGSGGVRDEIAHRRTDASAIADILRSYADLPSTQVERSLLTARTRTYMGERFKWLTFGGDSKQNFPKLLLHTKYPALFYVAVIFRNAPGSCRSDLTCSSLSLNTPHKHLEIMCI